MFSSINGLLYKMGLDQLLSRCVMEEEVQSVLQEVHEVPTGGHLGPDMTARKVLLVGLWWSTLYTREWVVNCNTC